MKSRVGRERLIERRKIERFRKKNKIEEEEEEEAEKEKDDI